MKRIASLLLTVVFILSVVTGCRAAVQPIAPEAQPEQEEAPFVLTMQIGNPMMTVNGEGKAIDENGTTPVVDNNRTLVPIRAIIEEMGGTVTWDAEKSAASLSLGENTVVLVIGSETATLNGEEKALDTAPKIINNRTMLPIRFIAESFLFRVDWDETEKVVTVTKQSAEASETQKPQEETPGATDPETDGQGKVLVVYFSATGSTKKVAETIQAVTDADIFELVPTEAYTSDDLNWNNSTSRVNAEHNDESKRDIPLESTTVADFESYDTVFIGYPIWWGIAAWPVNNFVKDNDFTGKTVIPFCTSASSGVGNSDALLHEMNETGTWLDGKRFRSSASENDVKDWVESLNLTDSADNG